MFKESHEGICSPNPPFTAILTKEICAEPEIGLSTPMPTVGNDFHKETQEDIMTDCTKIVTNSLSAEVGECKSQDSTLLSSGGSLPDLKLDTYLGEPMVPR